MSVPQCAIALQPALLLCAPSLLGALRPATRALARRHTGLQELTLYSLSIIAGTYDAEAESNTMAPFNVPRVKAFGECLL